MNGDEPLGAAVWMRVATLEGEDPDGRRAREQQEARARDRERKQLAARSRQLARDRGLRDRGRAPPLARAGGTVAGVGLIQVPASSMSLTHRLGSGGCVTQPTRPQRFVNSCRGIAGIQSPHRRARSCRRSTATPGARPRQRARSTRCVATSRMPTGTARPVPAAGADGPSGSRARQVGPGTAVPATRHSGATHGALDLRMREAIKRFKYQWLLPVSEVIDDALIGRIEEALRPGSTPGSRTSRHRRRAACRRRFHANRRAAGD